MSYSYLGVNWIFSGQKLTFVSNSGFLDRAQTLTLTLIISRIRIFLAKRRWLTSYLTRITHLRKFEWILPEGNWVKASKLQKQGVNRNQDPGCPACGIQHFMKWAWFLGCAKLNLCFSHHPNTRSWLTESQHSGKPTHPGDQVSWA